VNRLSKDPRFAGVAVFEIDFDSGKKYLRQLEVRQQSTLIGFKGEVERRRSVGNTDPDALRKIFEAAL
jgi:thioredoxin 1